MRPTDVPDTGNKYLTYILKDYCVICYGLIQIRMYRDGLRAKEGFHMYLDRILLIYSYENMNWI